jgi:cytochrome c-type biogenesis protein CcmH/NrfG
MDNAYVDAGEMLADQYKQAGQVGKAIAVLKKLAAANPTDTTVAPILQQYEASSTATSTPATP